MEIHISLSLIKRIGLFEVFQRVNFCIKLFFHHKKFIKCRFHHDFQNCFKFCFKFISKFWQLSKLKICFFFQKMQLCPSVLRPWFWLVKIMSCWKRVELEKGRIGKKKQMHIKIIKCMY